MDPASLNLSLFPLSLGLRINELSFSADPEKCYIFTGQLGIDPTRIEGSLEDIVLKERYPEFRIDPEIAQLSHMPENMKINMKEIKDIVKGAKEYGAELEDFEQCMAVADEVEDREEAVVEELKDVS